MIAEYLQTNNTFKVFQRKEIAELFGFETRNKYAIELENGEPIGFAAEQGKGAWGIILRQLLGHWRPFFIQVFDQQKNPAYVAEHPFRFFFQRLEVKRAIDGKRIGTIQQRFGIIHKKFDILDERGKLIMHMHAPIWKLWTFPILKGDYEVALILKKWSGVLKEVFTDTDSFTIEFKSKQLTLAEKEMILLATLFIDIIFFEGKASNRS